MHGHFALNHLISADGCGKDAMPRLKYERFCEQWSSALREFINGKPPICGARLLPASENG
jgi:hypothetical protein